eukprot:COSAG01_NODE_1708_length_9425_cov_5.499893_2_plen_215_part_00
MLRVGVADVRLQQLPGRLCGAPPRCRVGGTPTAGWQPATVHPRWCGKAQHGWAPAAAPQPPPPPPPPPPGPRRPPPPPGTALRAISWLDHASTAPFTDPGNGEDGASRRQQCAWLAAAWDGGPATVWRVEGTAAAAATSATGGGPHLVGAWNVDCVGEYWELGGPSTRGGGTICCLAWQPLKGALPIPCWVVWARPQGVGNLTGQTTRARRRGS